jgi:hypothetical protein
MTLRLDNACGVDHMPTASSRRKPNHQFWFGIDQASQMVPGKVRQNGLSPGRDQIGKVGEIKSESWAI